MLPSFQKGLVDLANDHDTIRPSWIIYQEIKKIIIKQSKVTGKRGLVARKPVAGP